MYKCMFFKKKEKTEIKKWHWWAFGIIILLTIAVNLYAYYWPQAHMQIAGREIKVLVADTDKHRLKGMGGHGDFGTAGGLLFAFPHFGIHTMVMRDMKIPLDMVWIVTAPDNDGCWAGSWFRQLFFGIRPVCKGVVVEIAPNAQPEPGKPDFELTKYFTAKDSTMVLELPAGWTGENGLKIGDSISVY